MRKEKREKLGLERHFEREKIRIPKTHFYSHVRKSQSLQEKWEKYGLERHSERKKIE